MACARDAVWCWTRAGGSVTPDWPSASPLPARAPPGERSALASPPCFNPGGSRSNNLARTASITFVVNPDLAHHWHSATRRHRQRPRGGSRVRPADGRRLRLRHGAVHAIFKVHATNQRFVSRCPATAHPSRGPRLTASGVPVRPTLEPIPVILPKRPAEARRSVASVPRYSGHATSRRPCRRRSGRSQCPTTRPAFPWRQCR